MVTVGADDFRSIPGSAIRLGVGLVVLAWSGWIVGGIGTVVGALSTDGFARTAEIFLPGVETRSVDVRRTESKPVNVRPSVETEVFGFNWADRDEVT